MTTIAVATATPPIVCPSWCTVSYEDHVEELPNLEGYVVHWSAPGDVRHSRAAFVDNTIDPSDPPMVYINEPGVGLSLTEAETLARRILAAVEEARA